MLSFIIKKILRQKRRAEIKSKIASGHKEKDDPCDVEAIKNLENNFGDWELKASNHYSVPVEKQVDTKSKLKELISCEESLHETKKSFNQEVMALQKKRSNLVNSIRNRNEKVLEISVKLREPVEKESLWLPCDQEGEVDTDCEQERKELDPKVDLSHQRYEKKILPQRRILSSTVDTTSSPRSSIEREERYEKEVMLRHEMSDILSSISNDAQEFDQSLHKLKKERFQLGIDLTNDEIRQTIMMQELKILASLEKEGNQLISNRDLCNSKKMEVRDSIRK